MISLYANNEDYIVIEHFDKTSNNKLPALKINGNYISPKDGVDNLELRNLVIKKLQHDGIKGNISSSLKIKEITTKEIWANNQVQLFKVVLEYAQIDGVAVVKNHKVQIILSGMPTEAIFIADLDNDYFYEIYTNIFMGSGIISEDILGYNVVSGKSYHLSKRFKENLHLYIDKGILKVNIKSYSNNKNTQSENIGSLTVKEHNHKNELFIKYDNAHN